tara:strand:- start:58250 stop:58474 length:225 start_codon:yes stop_codon:yes gene_type:complete
LEKLNIMLMKFFNSIAFNLIFSILYILFFVYIIKADLNNLLSILGVFVIPSIIILMQVIRIFKGKSVKDDRLNE